MSHKNRRPPRPRSPVRRLHEGPHYSAAASVVLAASMAACSAPVAGEGGGGDADPTGSVMPAYEETYPGADGGIGPGYDEPPVGAGAPGWDDGPLPEGDLQAPWLGIGGAGGASGGDLPQAADDEDETDGDPTTGPGRVGGG